MYPTWVILSVDPGETTGLAVSVLYKQRTPHPQPPANVEVTTHPVIQGFHMSLSLWGETTYDDAPRVLRSYARHASELAVTNDLPKERVAVVVENFVITRTAMQQNATWSSEVTGMARAMGEVEAPFHYWDKTQKPAEMKTAILQPGVLKEMGFLRKREFKVSSHMVDALGHAVLFAARNRNGQITRQ